MAVDGQSRFLGLSIVDLGPVRSNGESDSKQPGGVIEAVLVTEHCRRQGIGKALLQKTLQFAFQSGAHHTRWMIPYANAPAVSLARSVGAVLIPEEETDRKIKDKYYAVVAVNPNWRKSSTLPATNGANAESEREDSATRDIA